VISGQGWTYCWEGGLGGDGEGGLVSGLLLCEICFTIRSDMGFCVSVCVFICIFIYSDCVCRSVVTCSVWDPLFSLEYDQCSLYCIVCYVSSMFCANLEFDFLSLITRTFPKIYAVLPYILYLNGHFLYFRKCRFC
jgi:hypothetical protein